MQAAPSFALFCQVPGHGLLFAKGGNQEPQPAGFFFKNFAENYHPFIHTMKGKEREMNWKGKGERRILSEVLPTNAPPRYVLLRFFSFIWKLISEKNAPFPRFFIRKQCAFALYSVFQPLLISQSKELSHKRKELDCLSNRDSLTTPLFTVKL